MDTDTLCMDFWITDSGRERMAPMSVEDRFLSDQEELWNELLMDSPLTIGDEYGDVDSEDALKTNNSTTEVIVDTVVRSPQCSETDQLVGMNDFQTFANEEEVSGPHDIISNRTNVTINPVSRPSGRCPESVKNDFHFGKAGGRSTFHLPVCEAETETHPQKRRKVEKNLSEMKTRGVSASTCRENAAEESSQWKGIPQLTNMFKQVNTIPEGALIMDMITEQESQRNSEPSGKSKWAEQLLVASAVAVTKNNMLRTQHLMWVLSDLACHSGDANQRLASYGLKALLYRLQGSGSWPSAHPVLNSSFSWNGPRSLQRALLRFHDVSPWHQMVYNIANEAILEACEGHKSIHVVDIGVSHGTQWPTFIEALAKRPSGPPKLMRLTTVNNPHRPPFSGEFEIGSSAHFLSRLQPFASKMGIKLQLHTVSIPLESLRHDDLALNEGEALIICTQFRLHQLSESTNTSYNSTIVSPRDAFLKFLQQLKPDIFILSENDADHCSPDFLTRFREAVDFHWKFLDSTSASFKGRDCEERHVIENEAAKILYNTVASQSGSQTERNECHTKWKSRIMKAGFSAHPLKDEVLENAKAQLRKYDTKWDLAVNEACMLLRWKAQTTTFCSVWK